MDIKSQIQSRIDTEVREREAEIVRLKLEEEATKGRVKKALNKQKTEERKAKSRLASSFQRQQEELEEKERVLVELRKRNKKKVKMQVSESCDQ